MLSTNPPTKPDIIPTVVPIKTVIIEVSNAMVKTSLAPYINCPNISRPRLSVPSKCSLEGGKYLLFSSVIGLYGMINLPKRAINTKKSMIIVPVVAFFV